MSNDWGPHFIMPTEALKTYSGSVLLRENLDEGLLQKELKEIGVSGPVVKITNPWYYRKKNTQTWIKIGESENREENFPVKWDTESLENGDYEVLGFMHVFVGKDAKERAVSRQGIVGVTVNN
jgi:hypothetical protein